MKSSSVFMRPSYVTANLNLFPASSLKIRSNMSSAWLRETVGIFPFFAEKKNWFDNLIRENAGLGNQFFSKRKMERPFPAARTKKCFEFRGTWVYFLTIGSLLSWLIVETMCLWTLVSSNSDVPGWLNCELTASRHYLPNPWVLGWKLHQKSLPIASNDAFNITRLLFFGKFSF